MAENNDKALIKRDILEENVGSIPSPELSNQTNVPFTGLASGLGIESDLPTDTPLERAMKNLNSLRPDPNKIISKPLSELSSERYPYYTPGAFNNEDAYGQGQSWASKMVSGVGKGLALTGTTFLQTTVGSVYGLGEWASTGKFSSFYNNDFTKSLDDINKKMENELPNYYTDAEKDKRWYSPSKIFSANFIFDGIVKNLGFAAGAALSTYAFAPLVAGAGSLFAQIPKVGKLLSVGRGAQVLAATEQALQTSKNVASTYGAISKLSNRFLATYKTLNPAQRVIVAGLATTGEAGIEAFHNMNEYRDELVMAYKEEYGFEPVGKDLDEINLSAEEVGNKSFGLNTALLSATNYIQFPKILGSSYKAERGMIGGLSRNINDIAVEGGKFVAKVPKTRFGKIAHSVRGGSKYLFSASEAFEEGSQFAITKGTQDYYNKKYNHDEKANFIDSMIEGVKQTITTDEGMENILIGGLSGSIMLARGKYRTAKAKRENTQAAIKAFNDFPLSNFTKDTIDSVVRGVSLQEERERLLSEGDIVNSKSIEADYIINYLTPRIKYGRFDLVLSDINDYKDLASTEEGFLQLQQEGKVLEGDTREAYLARLDSLEEKATSMKSIYQSIALRYSAQRNKEGELAYPPEVVDKMVYAAMKIDDFDRRIPQLTGEVAEKLVSEEIDIEQVLQDVFDGKNDSYIEAVTKLGSSSLTDSDQLIQQMEDAAILTVQRKKFIEEYNDMKNNPSAYKELKSEPATEESGEKKTVRVKTKSGEKDYEIGTEYYVGRIVETDEKGREVYRPNVITFLKDNGDGTIRIKDKNGKERDIKASVLEDYRLGKVSAVENNPKAKFFMENWNNVVYWNTGKKKGGKIAGRLEHDPDTGNLFFAYVATSRKGKRYVKRIPIEDLSSFTPKKGFTEGVFTFGRELTPSEKKAISDESKEKKSPEETVNYELNKQEGRRQVLIDLFNEIQDRFTKTSKLIEQKKTDLKIINEDIVKLKNQIEKAKEDTTATRGLKFKSSTRKMINAATRLANTKDELINEIEILETEKAETESIISYVEDAAQNSEDFFKETASRYGPDFQWNVFELEEQINLLKESINKTTKEISAVTRLIDSVEKAFNSALDFIQDLIGGFKKIYPNVPSVVGQEWIDFLKANPRFLKYKPTYKDDLKELERIVAEVEDVDIAPNEKLLDEFNGELKNLKESLAEAEKELMAKEVIHDKLKKVYDAYQSKKVEEQKISNDKKTIKAAVGTQDKKNVPTTNVEEGYEANAKKAIEYIWRSTIGVMRGKVDQVRANNFGFRYEKMPNKENIRGVYVTMHNEESIIPGLTEHIENLASAPIDREDLVVMVMVDVSNDTPVLVNEMGEPFNNAELSDNPLEHVIYQVMPLEKLQWSNEYGKESMFRSSVPDDVRESVTKQYAEYRKDLIEKSKTPLKIDDLHEIQASFGFPKYSQALDENGKPIWKDEKKTKPVIDYSERTAVEDAGLIEEDDYYGDELIMIPTTNTEVSQGTTSFDAPFGVPFIQLPNAIVPLKNRKHTRKEAENIFGAIYKLADNMLDGLKGLNHEESVALINYLKSVVYWSIPETREGKRKEDAFNSVFWEKDSKTGKFMLTISGKGQRFLYTPKALLENKEVITAMLKNMYVNVNNSMAKKVDQPYNEVLSVTEEGTLETRTWVNYQAFLLSNKFIANNSNDPNNGKARNKDLPLATAIAPITEEQPVNRTGIYFYTTDNAEKITPPETRDVPKLKKKKKKAKKVGTKEIKGERREYKSPNGNTLVYTITDNNDITVLAEKDLQSAIDAYKVIVKKQNPKFTDREVLTEVRRQIKNTIRKSLGLPLAKKVSSDVLVIDDDMLGDESERKSSIFKRAEEDVEEAEEAEEAEEEKPISSLRKALRKTRDKGTTNSDVNDVLNNDDDSLIVGDEALREITDYEGPITKENWPEFESWLKNNFPNVPVYRVKNVIQATNGRQAWGMFHEGAIYVYENAEVGTGYHEVFEGVWKMFASPEEKTAVETEFSNRSGSFKDRPSGKTIKYSEATPQQIKEQLAEEFREYVQNKKSPRKPERGRPYIAKLFYDLVKFIRGIFVSNKGLSKIDEMFRQIDEGRYKKYIPYQNNLSFAKQGVIDIEDAFGTNESEFSLVGISDRERSDILQHMTYLTLHDVVSTDSSIFNVINRSRTDLYSWLKPRILKTIKLNAGLTKEVIDNKDYTPEQEDAIALMVNVSTQWDDIIDRHTEYLRAYDIEFDENDELAINDDEKVREDPYGDPTKIDSFKKTNSAVRLLLATIPVVNEEGKRVRSSIGGAILIPTSEVYVSLMNKLHDATSVENMLTKLKDLARGDANYRALYYRVAKQNWEELGINLENVNTEHSERLLSAFYKTFKKQNPEVKVVTILENGEVVVGNANLSTAAAQLRDDYRNGIVVSAKSGNKYFKYDKKSKSFIGNSKELQQVRLNDLSSMTKFLNTIGIPFTLRDANKLKGRQLSSFKQVVAGIRESIKKSEGIVSFTGKALSINNNLLELGYLQSAVNNPEFDSTFFNVNNERTQSFIGTNPASDLHDFLSQLPRLDERSLADSSYEYLKTDPFSEGSTILSRMFTPKGARIRTKESQGLLKVAYVSGTDNQMRGRKTQSSRLSYKDRLTQELNLNSAGYYLNLVPGDASMEWAVYMGNPVSKSSITNNDDSLKLIFKNYFVSELNLSRDGRQVARGRNSKDMRFFKSILGDKLHDAIISETELSSEQVYEEYGSQIQSAINKFIRNQNKQLENTLVEYKVLELNGEGQWNMNNIVSDNNMSDTQLKVQLSFMTINFMIANIELHKLLYSDPYQYSDELKRIKNFNSPRQALISNSPKMNAVLQKVRNEGYERGDIGWTDFTRDHFRSTTYDDVSSAIEEMEGYEDSTETDGGGMITLRGLRNFKLRVGEWNDSEERQYRYDIAWEKNHKHIPLTQEEEIILSEGNPQIKSVYTPLKPIVSGNKANGKPYNDIILDKFALYPLSYRMIYDIAKAGNSDMLNAMRLYEKMYKEDIDYVVFESSRKVGATSPNRLYNEDGTFNNSEYTDESIINVPFHIMSVQAEVPSKDSTLVTRGTQVTKLMTMDYMESGVPVDYNPKEEMEGYEDSTETDDSFNERFRNWTELTESERKEQSPLYKEIMNNQNLLEAQVEIGYNNLLLQLGIQERGDTFAITNLSKAAATLRNEILKREVNDNTSDALQAFLDGKSVLEATPAYSQVKNILYSIAKKEVISPKINGGMKVLIPSTLFESVRAKEITVNGKKVHVSDILKFYEKDGKQVCEIMVGRWFNSKMSDAQLIKYLNNTKEGQRILSGIAFRIPTQKQNSVESFVVKQFLPKEFGDSVVLPAAMVTKSGADFDIDKETMYLKNVYTDVNGDLKLIPFFGTGESARKKFEGMFDRGEFLSKQEYKELQELIDANKEGTGPGYQFIKGIFGEMGVFTDQEVTEDFLQSVTDIGLKDAFVNNVFKKSVQNEYIESSQRLVSNPLNFDRLVKPNSADQLKKLSKKITEKIHGETFGYEEVGNMLDRGFMSNLRHAFVTGKQAIGISAVNQTNHAQNQRQLMYIDPSRLDRLSEEDKEWIGDGIIRFNRFNKVRIDKKDVAVLSMIKNADHQDISEIIAQFIDGYVDISKGPWIMELGATSNVAATWLFLIKVGVPVDTVAYFMNQPIIRQYLRSVESAGYSWLFLDNIVRDTKMDYPSSVTKMKSIPGKIRLEEMVGMSSSDMSKQQKGEQQFILDEFLKYAKMSQQMFSFTQGSNFDTATFNDPYLIFKKFEQLRKAQNTIINDVNKFLKNSFVGKLTKGIVDSRNALSQLLISDQDKVRKIIQKTLLPYVDMSDKDFIKLSQKAVTDLFDYAVQVDQGLNNYIKEILVNDGGVGTEVVKLMNKIGRNPNHPLHGNYIIGKKGILRGIPSRNAELGTGVNNIRVKGLGNKAYDQNNIIYAFRELREYMKDDSLIYDRILQLAVLQSGLSASSLSFTSVLPHEDFEMIYNKTLMKLNQFSNLDNFNYLSVFQRNNWANDKIVPYMRAPLIHSKKSGKYFYNPSMEFLDKNIKKEIRQGAIPQVMNIRASSREAQSKHIVYTWEKQESLLPEDWNKKYRMRRHDAIKQIKQEMRSRGDFSYINKGLFERVTDMDGEPLTTHYTSGEGDVIKQHVYKAINAWGDGQRANEFYDVAKPSVLENGFIKVQEVDNSVIIDTFNKYKLADKFEGVAQNNWENTDNSSENPFKC